MKGKNKASVNALCCYFLIVVLFVAIRIISSFGLLDFMGGSADYVFSLTVQVGLLFCISVFMFKTLQKKKSRVVFQFYGFKKISIKSFFIAVGIGAIVFFLNIFVASFFDVWLGIFGYKFSQGGGSESYPIYMLFVNLIFTALLPAICEETVHRGMLLRSLNGWGSKYAIILSALLFGLLHMNIEQFFYATVIGLFLGYLTLVCDTIYPAMIIHFMNNALSVYLGFSSSRSLPFSKIFSSINNFLFNNFFLGMMFVLLLCALLLYLLLLLTKKLMKDTNSQSFKLAQDAMAREFIRQDYLVGLKNTRAELEGNFEEVKKDFSEEEVLQMIKNVNTRSGLMSEIDNEIMHDSTKKKDGYFKLLLVGIFILIAGGTIFTFVWGLL